MRAKISKATGREITKSFADSIINKVGSMNDIARGVNNLRLVTDVR